jgi:hypothetical protein
MSNYTKATNFATKDTLPTGNSGKIVKGTEIDDEFNAIASAVSSKADTASPTFTGTPAAPTATLGSNTTQIATTAFVTAAIADEGLGTIATQNSNAVTITGGSVTGITDLAIADGGTGVSTIAANAVVLGNGTSAIQTVAPGTSGNVLTSNGTTWQSTALPTPFAWNVVDVSSETTSYSIPTNTILVLGTAYHYMGSNQGSAMSVTIKNSSGSTLNTYVLTGGNEQNGGDGGSGLSSRSAYTIAIPSTAWGGTLEFSRTSGSGSWNNTINQIVKSA